MAPKNSSVKKVSFPLSKLKKAAVTYSVHRIQNNLRTDRISTSGAIYLAGVLEYLTAEVLELAGDSAKASKTHQINPRHIVKTINNDSELDKLVEKIEIPCVGVPVDQHEEHLLQKIYKGNRHTHEESNQSEEMEG